MNIIFSEQNPLLNTIITLNGNTEEKALSHKLSANNGCSKSSETDVDLSDR